MEKTQAPPVEQVDPREAGPKPPYPEQVQKFPGLERQMQPQADHGEQTYRGSGKLTGRAALITGGDSGIGRAVALAFAREGADVAISHFNEDEDAEQTAQLVKSAGRRAIAMAGDIGDEAHCQRLVDQTLKTFGRLDILVNNAAYQMAYQDISEISAEEFERAYRTNVFAMFYLCKAAIPHMPFGGSIINTASVEAYQPLAKLLPYASTKGAIVTFSKSLAHMVAQKGLRVNVVAPGPVWTPLIPYSMPQEDVTSFGDTTPLGRPAQPAELAPVYVLLASNDASYITGMVYGVTGGMLTA
jgi:NAD(P)-dependent dehydrogenase (short-subunit alcohol dehydrogenase family)